MKKSLEKDSLGSWNTIPPVPADEIKNVNCHKFVLYVTGKISWEEMISDPNIQEDNGIDFTFGNIYQNISDISFIPIKNLKDLLLLTDNSCEIGKSYVGQILDAQTGGMAHSFIIQKKSDGKYICFDKPGFKYLFSVYGLEKIINFVNKDGEKSNQNQKWRFVPINDF